MKKKIKIYTTPICPECERVKKLLRDKKIDFEEIDIFGNKEKAEEMINKSGQKRVPVTEIGEEVIVGFNKKSIEEAL